MASFMNALFGGAGSRPASAADKEGIESRSELKSLLDTQSSPKVEAQVLPSRYSISVDARTASGAARSTSIPDVETQIQQQHTLAQKQVQEQWRHQDTQQQRSQQEPPHIPAHANPAPPAPAASHWLLTVVYGLTNLSSVVMIVVANKKVLFTHKFGFAITLTWLHAVFTAIGMWAMASGGFFEMKRAPWRKTAPVAAVYVAFVVFNNLSIQMNPLGFYQMSKLAITPVLVAIEWLAYSKTASPRVLASIGLLLVGITLCTVTDTQVSSNPQGMVVAAAAVLVTSLYQVWAGTKQKELGLNGMQLLQQVSPISVLLLGALIPLFEPVGLLSRAKGTILGYDFSVISIGWITASSALGLVVTLSTFLFIGATSSLTYNVVGHLKTVLIVAAGVTLFGDEMGLKKFAGLAVAMSGIVWYSHIKLEEARQPVAVAAAQGGGGGSKC